MPTHFTDAPEGPKYLAVHVGDMTAALHARAAAKMQGVPLKGLKVRWDSMGFPNWSWRDVPSADEWVKMLLSRYLPGALSAQMVCNRGNCDRFPGAAVSAV